jgi:hypothetical protein
VLAGHFCDRKEILVSERRIQAVYTYRNAFSIPFQIKQRVDHNIAGLFLDRQRNAVFQIQQDDIGLALGGFLLHFFQMPRNS